MADFLKISFLLAASPLKIEGTGCTYYEDDSHGDDDVAYAYEGGGECLKSDVSILLAIACQDCERYGFVVYCYTLQHVVYFFLMVRFRLYWLSALMPSCRVY